MVGQMGSDLSMNYHDGITTRRMELTTGAALQLIGDADPAIAQSLLADEADVIAAFDRTADNGEAWQTLIFAAAYGTICYTIVEELDEYDAETDEYVFDRMLTVVERSDAFGDCYGDCQSFRLFPIPSKRMIYGA